MERQPLPFDKGTIPACRSMWAGPSARGMRQRRAKQDGVPERPSPPGFRASGWLRVGCVSRHALPRSASCAFQVPRTCVRGNNRSKFNLPLGVEAQGFCVIR
jgi:hypothetical protein